MEHIHKAHFWHYFSSIKYRSASKLNHFAGLVLQSFCFNERSEYFNSEILKGSCVISEICKLDRDSLSFDV